MQKLLNLKNLSATILCAAALLLHGCTTQTTKETETTRPQASAELEPVTIAQFGHVFLYMPLYVAAAQGFFEEEGLKVKIVSTGGDEKTFTAVASDNAQFGVADPTFAAIARQRGSGGKVVASIVQGVPLWIVTFKKDIPASGDPKLLNGRKIATITAPSTCYAVMAQLLKSKGINAQIVQGAYGSLLAILQANQADMALELEPVVSIAVKNGAHILYSPAANRDEFAFTGLTVSDDYVKTHPQTVQKAVNAINKAMIYIQNNFPGAVAIAQKEFPELDKTVVKEALKRLVNEHTIPLTPRLKKEAWDNAIDLRRTLGDIKDHGSYEENVDMSFVEKLPKMN